MAKKDERALGGNALTMLMHAYTLHEFRKMHLLGERGLCRVVLEKELTRKQKGKRKAGEQGSFDFFVECEGGKCLGVEVLTRPTKGKLAEKMRYAKHVDEFIFVLPEGALALYRKPHGKVFHKQHRGKSLPKEFADSRLHAWLFDTTKKKFTEKDLIREIFSCRS